MAQQEKTRNKQNMSKVETNERHHHNASTLLQLHLPREPSARPRRTAEVYPGSYFALDFGKLEMFGTDLCRGGAQLLGRTLN